MISLKIKFMGFLGTLRSFGGEICFRLCFESDTRDCQSNKIHIKNFKIDYSCIICGSLILE